MAQKKKRSRIYVSVLALLIISGGIIAAFWPRAVLVDMGKVTRSELQVTIDEEGRTRVRDAYIVSTPVAGRLQRVQVRPGDPVIRGETIVAHMLPTNPAALDVRTREQAQAAVAASEAALRVARADLNAAIANRELAQAELDRTRQLSELDIASDAALERVEQSARVANAAVDTAEAAISMREAETENARAQLIGFDDLGLAAAIGAGEEDIPLYSPADGRILRLIQQSETTLPAGAPVMEIGNIEGDLEIVVDLLSTDAVQVSVGDPVMIEDWGGPEVLRGTVDRVDPFGVTKFSALGVEEQRVNAVIAFDDSSATHGGLGHGFRVEVRVVIWEASNALTVPSAALFREAGEWAVFAVEDGVASLTPVEIGKNNGVDAEVLSGLEDGQSVVLYPSSAIAHGTSVAARVIN